MQHSGAIQGSSQTNPSSSQNSPSIRPSKLIQGLKKEGNGIVVKVPPGVKSVNIKMRSPSKGVDLGKVEPVRVDVKSGKGGFITLRIDQEGQIVASLVDDKFAENDLDKALQTSSAKVGIIQGKNTEQNECSSLKVMEFMRGTQSVKNLQYLSAVKLVNVSPRLKLLFEKFKHMTEEKLRSKTLNFLKLVPTLHRRRQSKGSGQHTKKQKKEGQDSEDGMSASVAGKPVLRINKIRMKDKVIREGLKFLKDQMIEIQTSLNELDIESKPSNQIFQQEKPMNEKMYRLQKQIRLLSMPVDKSANTYVEQKKLFIGIFMKQRKTLFREFNAITNKRLGLIRSRGVVEDSLVEEKIRSYEAQAGQVHFDVKVVNELIKDFGGHGVLA